LIQYFNAGWEALLSALQAINDNNINTTIHIRGEPHSISEALTRSVTHLTYHVGQIAMVARMVHKGDWRWLTIAPGSSAEHNDKTWGTNASRNIFSRHKGAR
ncbi:MAG: DUF1572 family protein, partial [bacterium]